MKTNVLGFLVIVALSSSFTPAFALEKHKSVMQLSKDLESQKDEEVLSALRELKAHGPNAVPAIGQILRLLDNKNPDIRSGVALTLAAIDDGSEQVCAALSRLAADSEKNVVVASLKTMAALAPRISKDSRLKMRQPIVALMSHDNVYIRLFSSIALGRLEPMNNAPKKQLAKMMIESDDAVQCAAIKEIAIGGKPALLVLLQKNDHSNDLLYKINVISALGLSVSESDVEPKFVEESIKKYLNDESLEVRRHAERILELTIRALHVCMFTQAGW